VIAEANHRKLALDFAARRLSLRPGRAGRRLAPLLLAGARGTLFLVV
jgi:hypothetical protein